MEPKELDGIKEQLKEQQSKLTAKAGILRTELSEVDSDLDRVGAALEALSGKQVPSPVALATKKERKKPSAPSVSKVQVIDFIERELLRTSPIQKSELKDRIEQKVTQSGYSRMGLSLRFKEALSDSRFHDGAEGVGLRRRNASANPIEANSVQQTINA